MSLTLAPRRPVLADVIARLFTRVASGLTTSAWQRQPRVLGCNRNIVLTVPSGRGPTTKRWSQVVVRIRHITGCARALGAAHVPIRAVLRNGLYCCVPSANTAFKTAQQVFQEMDNTA